MVMRRPGSWLAVLLGLFISGIVHATQTLDLGMFSYQQRETIERNFQPLVDYLNEQLGDQHVTIRLRVLETDEIERELNQNRLDLLFTNPSHYLQIRSQNNLSGALATLVRQRAGRQTHSLGGVIITRPEQTRISTLADLRGQRIAIPGTHFLGGYQSQAGELFDAGIHIPEDARIQIEERHDSVIQAVVEGRAEAGFVRTGIIEELIADGRLRQGQLRVINPQNLPGFPYVSSTRLYPEWPFVALPQVPAQLVRRISLALLTLTADHPAARAAGIAGFIPPLDYLAVEKLARDLRLPPYDITPRISWRDIWLQNRIPITGFLIGMSVILLLSALLLQRNRSLAQQRHALSESLAAQQAILAAIPDLMFELDSDGRFLDIWSKNPDELATSRVALLGRTVAEMLPDDAVRQVTEALREAQSRGFSKGQQFRLKTLGGRLWFELSTSLKEDGAQPPRFIMLSRNISDRKQAEQALRDSEEKYRQLLQSTSEGFWLIDPGLYTLEVNDALCKMLGYPRRELIGRQPFEFVDEDNRRIFAEQMSRIPAVPHRSYEICLQRQDGGSLYALFNATTIFTESGQVNGAFALVTDITRRRQTEEQLRLAASVFTYAREGIVITDASGKIIEVNESFFWITGYSREEAIGQNPSLLKSGRHEPEFYENMWHDLITKGHWYGEVWNRRKNGEIYAELLTISAVRDDDGGIRNYVALFSDITVQKEQQQHLEHLAHYDALTGLPNRILLADRLLQAMVHAQRRDQSLAVVYLDLDGFKEVNDNHGHESGDRLLIILADRMKKALRRGDTIARLGGDEFVAVLIDLGSEKDSLPLLERLLRAAAEPVQINGLPLEVSASLGVTFYPQREEVDADQLLRQSDQAMYQAKLAGKNRFHLFDAEQDRTLRGQIESIERIQQALVNGEFVLYYQPKVNLRNGQVLAAEALIRWRHPQRGLLMPAQFLPMIEDQPLSVEVGEWVIETALTQLEHWRRSGLHLHVSVNVGARQLQQGNFIDRLRHALERHPTIRPQCLELEILETSALQDISQVSRIMDTCQTLGVSFALDDFGTGYSSLTYLKRLPASQLKIDQSFVRDMSNDPDNLAILEGILSLADAFHRQPIAEGVETADHGELLLQLGCDLAQGYGIAKPMPAEELPGWIQQWLPDPAWQRRPRLDRERLPLLFALVEHRAWMHALEAYLHEDKPLLPTMDSQECRFGQWLHHQQTKERNLSPALRELKQLHQQIHDLASSLAHARQAGAPLGDTQLPRLHRLRDQLVERIRKLLDEDSPWPPS